MAHFEGIYEPGEASRRESSRVLLWSDLLCRPGTSESWASSSACCLRFCSLLFDVAPRAQHPVIFYYYRFLCHICAASLSH